MDPSMSSNNGQNNNGKFIIFIYIFTYFILDLTNANELTELV